MKARRTEAPVAFQQYDGPLMGMSFLERQGCIVTGITVEGTPASAQDGDISFEALQKFGETVNFARGTVQEFVGP